MAKILVVDDSFFQRKMLSDILVDMGYEVVSAINGEEAIEQVDKDEFQLICLDLLMPGLSGIEVLTHFQGKEGVPPIIVISADIQIKKKEQCMALGAVAFIHKHINREEVEENVSKFIK